MTPRISQHFCCLCLQWVMDALVCHDPTLGWLPTSPNTSVVYDCSGLWMHSCAMIQPQDDSPHLPTLLLSMLTVGYGCTRVPWSNPRMTPRISQHFCCLWLQWVMDALVCHDPTPGWLPASPNTSVAYDCSGLWMHSCVMIQPQDDSPHLPTLLLSMLTVGYGCTRLPWSNPRMTPRISQHFCCLWL